MYFRCMGLLRSPYPLVNPLEESVCIAITGKRFLDLLHSCLRLSVSIYVYEMCVLSSVWTCVSVCAGFCVSVCLSE